MYDVGTGQNQQVAAHDAPIKCLAYIDMPNGSGQNGVLVTAGWDKKLKVGADFHKSSEFQADNDSTGTAEGPIRSCRLTCQKGRMQWTRPRSYW